MHQMRDKYQQARNEDTCDVKLTLLFLLFGCATFGSSYTFFLLIFCAVIIDDFFIGGSSDILWIFFLRHGDGCIDSLLESDIDHRHGSYLSGRRRAFPAKRRASRKKTDRRKTRVFCFRPKLDADGRTDLVQKFTSACSTNLVTRR